jgi:integrase
VDTTEVDTTNRLTRRALDTWLKIPTGSEWLWCGELKGFGARRHGSTKAAFVVQFRVGRGRAAPRRRAVLGEYPTISPEQAREQAVEHISAGWRGIDLVAEKRAQRAAQARQRDTFTTLAPTFHAARRAHLKSRSADQYESIWNRHILPECGSAVISELKRRDVARLMDKIEASVGTSVADRAREQLAIFFRWYAERDDDFVCPLVRTLKRHRKGAGARPMTDDELRQFWIACGNAGLAGAAGRFCLLTATRRTETTSASWSEMSDGIWTIPSSRYKTRREHVVPLSRAALAVVWEFTSSPPLTYPASSPLTYPASPPLTYPASPPTTSPYVFGLTESPPDPWSLWNAILDAGGPKAEGLSWHSLRKTARTLMSRAGVWAEHAERALGHVQGAIERAYDKHDYLDEKRRAFEALASQVDRIVNGAEGEKVVELKAA